LSLLLLGALLAASGCTRHADHSGPNGYCWTLGSKSCASDPHCQVVPGCCTGSSCAPADVIVEQCTRICSECDGLSESECKANPDCRADYCELCQCTPSYSGCSRAGSAPPPCPAVACPALFCDCSVLDEQTCEYASHTSAGCTVARCPDCKGGFIFAGCLPPNAGDWACPSFCANDNCHANQDCSGGICLPPGAKQCPGICISGVACSGDGDCDPGQVCDTAPCLCAPGGRICQPACNAVADCAEGLTCAGGHCQALACASSGGCPANFECVLAPGGSGSASCQRRACRSDGDCPGGTCVDGACYSGPGTCAAPPPP
jgi:hypothetical protein